MSHSEGHPERFSYMQKREEGDRGDQEEKRGIKSGGRMVEINEAERNKEKRIKRNEDNLRDL